MYLSHAAQCDQVNYKKYWQQKSNIYTLSQIMKRGEGGTILSTARATEPRNKRSKCQIYISL